MTTPSNKEIEECVFCDESKIVSEVFWHTDNVMSFEPLNPVVKGHRVFVHKKHTKDFFDCPKTFSEVCDVVARCATSDEYNLITSKGKNATQSVFHLHIHLVPRKENDNLLLPWTGEEALQQAEQRGYERGYKQGKFDKEMNDDFVPNPNEMGMW